MRTKTSTGIEAADLLDGLNPEQLAVAKHHTGPIQVKAGAGSGKTHALVRRIAYLIVEHKENPRDICAVTFSKKAADEMNDRLHDLKIQTVEVGTWHRLAFQILRDERPELRTWEVDSKDKFRRIVQDVLGYRGMKWANADLTKVCSFISMCSSVLAEPGTRKARELAEAIWEAYPCNQNNVALMCEAYERASAAAVAQKLITFDVMILWAWRALQSPDAEARWSGRFKFVLQDEAQDCNLAQSALAKILAKEHGNYMIVGDPAQSIYGFRGAVPERFMAFPSEYPDAVEVAMNRNYRSGSNIIAAANASANFMTKGSTLGVDMLAERGIEGRVIVEECPDADDEGSTIVDMLRASHEDGVAWESMAVLYRTNAQSRGVEEACISARIPYVVLGGTNFYNRREVKDLLSYLRVASDRDGYDPIRRSINTPFRYLGAAFQGRIKDAYQDGGKVVDIVRRVAKGPGIWSKQRTSVEEWAGLVDATELGISKGVSPAKLLEAVISETGYLKYLTKVEGAETTENNRVSNVRELIRAAERFETVVDLLDYIDLTLKESKESQSSKGDRVTLCSLHRSKGLEWETVAVIGCNEKILPHGRSTNIDEERRLFYVGVTRARDTLILSHVHSATFGSNVVSLPPSRFIAECGFGPEVEVEA